MELTQVTEEQLAAVRNLQQYDYEVILEIPTEDFNNISQNWIDPRNLEWMREANCPVVSDCSFLTCILTVRTVLFFVLRLEEYILFRYVAAAQSCCSIYKHGKEVLFMWSKLLNSLPRIFIRESLRIFMI